MSEIEKYQTIKENLSVDISNITDFVDNMPDTLGIYCYRVGTKENKKEYNLLFVSDDLKSWYENNKFIDPKKKEKYYEFIFDDKHDFIEHPNIKYNGCIYNCTLVSLGDFMIDVATWRNLYIVKCAQQIILSIKSNEYLNNIIKYNRDSSMLLTLFMLDKEIISYDMIINRLNNMISFDYGINNRNGNTDLLKLVYKDSKYFTLNDNQADINLARVNIDNFLLPSRINECIDENDNMIKCIDDYISEISKNENNYIKEMRKELDGIISASVSNYIDKQKKKQL